MELHPFPNSKTKSKELIIKLRFSSVVLARNMQKTIRWILMEDYKYKSKDIKTEIREVEK
jgi:hypothetical protein